MGPSAEQIKKIGNPHELGWSFNLFKPSSNSLPKETLSKLQNLLNHNSRGFAHANFTLTDKDIPPTSKANSGYLLLFITLIFATDLHLNKNNPPNTAIRLASYPLGDIFLDMYNNQLLHNYGLLSREWIANFYINKTDIIQSLPEHLRSIFESIIEEHLDEQPTPHSPKSTDEDESDEDEKMFEHSSPSSCPNNANNPTSHSPESKDADYSNDDEDIPENSSSSFGSNMSVDEDMF